MSESEQQKMVAVYAGTFDPPTKGHEFVIREAARFASSVIVAVGRNPEKHPVFSVEERVAMLRELTADLPNVEVRQFDLELLVDFVQQIGANCIVRGVRSIDDFKYENVMWYVNHKRAPSIMTWWLPAPQELSYVSSSFVKGFVGTNGWEETVREFLPESVYNYFVAKYRQILHDRAAKGERSVSEIVAEVLPELVERAVPKVLRCHLPKMPSLPEWLTKRK